VLKQGLDFPFDKRIETTDRFLTMWGQKILKTKVRFPIREKNLKQRIDCLQSKAKKFLKQRWDFPFDKRIEMTIECLQCMAKKVLKQRLDFPFDKRIETMDRLVTMPG